jgi:hypothetical protein
MIGSYLQMTSLTHHNIFHNRSSLDLQVVTEFGRSFLICGDVAEGVELFYIDHIFPEQLQMASEIPLIAIELANHSV